MKLKRCPFCGKKARYLKRKKKYKGRHAVGCSNVSCLLWLPADVVMKKLH